MIMAQTLRQQAAPNGARAVEYRQVERLLRAPYLAPQPQECFLATTLAGIPASVAQGGKERFLWRLKGLV